MSRLLNPKIEYLYIRADGIGDDAMAPICANLTANTTLRCLDLSMNVFKQPGILHLAKAIKENDTLELLGIGSMNLTIDDLQPFLNEFCKKKVTPEEAKVLQEKKIEKEAIIEKNKKGKEKIPIPRVNNIVQDEQGNFYEILKENFRHLNIGLNKLEDTATSTILQFLEKTPSQLKLTVASKLFSKEAVKTLTAKYADRVIA